MRNKQHYQRFIHTSLNVVLVPLKLGTAPLSIFKYVKIYSAIYGVRYRIRYISLIRMLAVV